MPTSAQNAAGSKIGSAMAIAHQLAPRLAAALVGYGIVLSLVTLPA